MNKPTILALSGITSFIVAAFVLQLFMRSCRKRALSEERKLNGAFTVQFIAAVLSFTVIISQALNAFALIVDLILKKAAPQAVMQVAQFGSLYIGLSVVWFLLTYYVSAVICIPVLGKRKGPEETGGNNYNYFLIKGVVHLGLVVVLSPAFDALLRTMLPAAEMPFYH